MEYTNDVIFSVKYRDEVDCYKAVKHPKLHKILNIIEKDSYFTLTMIVSAIFLFVDYLIVMKFIELLS